MRQFNFLLNLFFYTKRDIKGLLTDIVAQQKMWYNQVYTKNEDKHYVY